MKERRGLVLATADLDFPRTSPTVKATLLAWIVFLACAPAALSDQISLPGLSGPPGSSIVFPVELTPQGGGVAGVQFDLQYDNAAMAVSASLGDAAARAGKNLYTADLSPDKRRFLIVGLNQTLIPGGTLVNLVVSVKANAPNGEYALALSNAVGTNGSGQSEPITSASGAVRVQGAPVQVRLQSSGVLNAASLLPGPVAPGQLVRLAGSAIGPATVEKPTVAPSSTALTGTAVLFDGMPAPLISAALNQIDIAVPYGVAGKSVTQMEVMSGGQVIAGLGLPVVEAVPGIFTVDSSGTGQGAILNQDSTVNSVSNPALKGSTVVLFATGAGQTNPPGMDGQVARLVLPKPVLPVSVRIGGIDAEILYAGAAPNFVAGVLLATCRIPMTVTSGQAVPVVLKVRTASSQPGVTMAIR